MVSALSVCEKPKTGRLTLARRLSGGVGSLHPRKGLGYPLEQVLDVVAELCTRLHKHEVVLLGFVLALLCRDLAFVIQIGLVAHQYDDDVVASLRPDIINPLLGVLKRLGV